MVTSVVNICQKRPNTDTSKPVLDLWSIALNTDTRESDACTAVNS